MTPCQVASIFPITLVFERVTFSARRVIFAQAEKIKALVVVCVLGRTSGCSSDSGFGGSSCQKFRPVYALAAAPGMCIGLISVIGGARVCSERSGWTKRKMTAMKEGKKGKKRKEKRLKFIIYLNISNNKHLHSSERKPLDSQDKQDK